MNDRDGGILRPHFFCDAQREIGAVDDHLVGAGQYALHGLDVEALARHGGRELVLLVDLVEARRLALGLLHDLRLVTERLLPNLGPAAARHTALTNTGGAIGQGLPVALGARLRSVDGSALPRAADVARLAAAAFARGDGVAPEFVEPAYLRDNVALTLAEQRAASAKKAAR